MKYYDMVFFDVDPKLQKRLGYSRIFVIGKDFAIQQTPKQSSIPIIIKSKDPNNLMRSLKDNNVSGIIFEDNTLSKKVIERAADMRKTIFIPAAHLFWKDVWERQGELNKIKRILAAAHSLKAKAVVVSLAQDKESLVSKDQMLELAGMMMDTGHSKFSIFGGEPYDN